MVYFINKQTGYKFAGYKSLKDGDELSFWNAEDSRVDYLNVEADDYLFPIVRKIFKSTSTNKNLSSDEIQEQVHTECLTGYEKMRIDFVSEHMERPDETIPLDEQAMEQPEEPMGYETEMNEMIEQIEMQMEQVQVERQVRELRHDVIFNNVPTMRA